MSSSAPRSVWLNRAAAASLVAVAVVIVALDVARVVARLGFDYDLLLWGDDYFMTSMLKLAAGLPVYTAVADANSTVYSPGGPYLHHALLAPFRLGTSLLANRLLNQAWLAAGVLLGTYTVIVVLRPSGGAPPGKLGRALLVVGAAAVIGLTLYANPVADSLHPTNLETIVLAATVLALARWTELPRGRRLALAVLLPVLALLVKQTAGAAVGLSLAWQLHRSGTGGFLCRAVRAAVPVVALGMAFAALSLGTHGLFKTWAFDILARHPFDWWKVKDLYAGYFLLFVPSLLTVTVVGLRALRRGAAEDGPWLRSLGLSIAYAPFALAALFKTMGGPNNLAVLGFLLVLAALPVWARAIRLAGSWPGTAGRGSRLWATTAWLAAAAQIGILYPRRRVQDGNDLANARVICEYASRRMACGERVHLGRGSVCYLRGGVQVPLDRLSSIVEVTVAGRAAELGFHGRVSRAEYDLLILPLNDILWFGGDFWRAFTGRYRPFFMTHGVLDNDFWFDGWQGYVSWPMVFFERVGDRGRHDVDVDNPGSSACD
jgi:hypothetical protein